MFMAVADVEKQIAARNRIDARQKKNWQDRQTDIGRERTTAWVIHLPWQ